MPVGVANGVVTGLLDGATKAVAELATLLVSFADDVGVSVVLVLLLLDVVVGSGVGVGVGLSLVVVGLGSGVGEDGAPVASSQDP